MKCGELAPGRQHYGLTLSVLLVASLAFALQQSMVVPALPTIRDELNASTVAVTFVFTGFLLTAAVSAPIVGRLGDMFGKDRMLLISLVLLAGGSLLCALSGSLAGLLVGRVIEGMAAAVFPLAFGIIRDEFPLERVATGIGLISATIGVGGALGVTLGGVIIDHAGYKGIFWVGTVVVLASAIAAFFWIPESPVKSPAKLDWGGAALLSGALVALLVTVSKANAWGWASPAVLGGFASATMLFVFWARHERRHPEPLVDIEMMRERAVLTTNLTALLIGFGMYGSFILITQLVQLPEATGYGFGATVAQAGLFMVPESAMMLIGGPLGGWVAGRYGSRRSLLIGTALPVLGYALLTVEHDTRAAVYVSCGILGLGTGFAFAAMANLVIEAVDPRRTGVATGMNMVMRTAGGSLGAQVMATIVASSVLASTGLPAESGFEFAFVLSGVVMVAAFMAALAVPRDLRSSRTGSS